MAIDQVGEQAGARRLSGRSQHGVAALAAALLLIIGAAGLLAACGEESAGSPPGADDAPFLLPAEGTDIGWAGATTTGGPDDDTGSVGTYILTWHDADDRPLTLSVLRPGAQMQGETLTTIDLGATPPKGADELKALTERLMGRPGVLDRAPSHAVDAGPLDPAAAFCAGGDATHGDPLVAGAAGRTMVFLDEGRSEPCSDIEGDFSALQAARNLRVVDEAEFRAFMDSVDGEISAPTTVTTSTTTTLDPGTKAYCAAVESFRASGTLDPATGDPRPEALPFLQAIRAAAPPDVQPALDAYISWVEAGLPKPPPTDVGPAGLTMTKDYASRCSGGPG